jgi:glycosyltransferase involved in cell wall biosynthesis
MPLVSVLITAYNREKYIGEAIQSVLDSTFTDYEIIIVDDCSLDRTLSIAYEYARKNDTIKVYCNEKNLGQFQNRNKAASYATGKYIKYLDSDDIISPEGLAIMVSGMEKDIDTGIGIEYYFPSPFIKDSDIPLILSSPDAYRSNFEGGGLLAVGPSFCIYSKEKFDTVKGFDESFGINTDVHLNLKIAAVSKAAVLQKDIVFWRRHNEQVHEGQVDQFNMLKEKFYIYKDILFSSNSPINDLQKKRYYKIQQILYARNLFKQFFLKGKLVPFFKSLSPDRLSFFQLTYVLIPIRLLRKVYQ